MTAGKSSKNFRILLATVAILTLAAFGMLIVFNGIAGGYDPNFHMARIHTLANNLRAFHFPNPIGLEYLGGMGYGVGFFYGNYWLYPFAILTLIGIPLTISYKLLLVILAAASMLSIAYTIKSLTKNNFAALASMPLYVLNNYFISAAFGRAAIGELFAFVFIPLALLFTLKIINGAGEGVGETAVKNEHNALKLGLVMAGLLVGHLLSFVLVLVTMILLLLLNAPRLFKNPRRLLDVLQAGLIGGGLSAVFLFPLVEQFLTQKFVDTSMDLLGNISLPFSSLNFIQAINPASMNVLHQGYVGPIIILLVVVSVLISVVKRTKLNNQYWTILSVSVFYSILLYSKPLVAVLSKNVPAFNTLQSLWRLNVILIPLYLILISFMFSLLPRKASFYVMGASALLVMVNFTFTAKNTLRFVHQRNTVVQVDYENNYGISRGEYLPVEFPKTYPDAKKVTTASVVAGQEGVELVKNDHHELILRIDSDVTTVVIPKVFYKGYVYQVKADKSGSDWPKALPLEKSDAGLGEVKLTDLNLDAGKKASLIRVKYRQTIPMWLGWAVTVITLVALCFLTFIKPNKIKKIRDNS